MRHRVFLAFAVSPSKIGGLEAYARELATQLQPHGWDLVVCFETEAPPAVREFLLSPGNVTLVSLASQSSMSVTTNLAMLRLLRRHRPDVLVYSIGGVVRWWPLLAKSIGCRSLYWDGTSRTRSAMNYRARAHVRWMMKPLDRSLCVTKFIEASSNREGIISPSKTRMLYSGTDTSREHASGDCFRQRYGIPANRHVVLQVSWLIPEKGIDVALRGAAEVLEQRRDVQFVFCGDGAHRQEYEALARELGIADHVTFTGAVSDLHGSGAFSAASLLIQCSQWQEAFGLVVAEGMSAGLPIVVSRIGGLPELIEDGVNGFLFDPPNVDQLAGAILRILCDPELRASMGAQSRRRAVDMFDLKKRVSDWIPVLAELASRRKPEARLQGVPRLAKR